MHDETHEQLRSPTVSVVVPAHNEEQTISRLLSALVCQKGPDLEILVVCNGCTDSTASKVSAFAADVRLIELDEPSKHTAMRLGSSAAQGSIIVFVDADVEIDGADIWKLVEPLRAGPLLATAPERLIPRDGVAKIVCWYYDVWEKLPQVRTGLFGRGVIALSGDGRARIASFPTMLSDDLVISEAFNSTERAIVSSACVIVHPPKRVRDLIRRRVRVATGVAQADHAGLRQSAAKTSMTELFRIASRDRKVAARMPIFLGITLITRLAAGRRVRVGDFDTWLRDESSRLG